MPNGILEESQKMRHLALFNPRGSVMSQKIKSNNIWMKKKKVFELTRAEIRVFSHRNPDIV